LPPLLLLLSINKVAQVTAIVTWAVFVDYSNIRANDLSGVHTHQLEDGHHAADEGEKNGAPEQAALYCNGDILKEITIQTAKMSFRADLIVMSW
jgi:hypothetical protein